MLLYLLFVFACGFCVCWLLILNYQQHANDSQRLLRLKRTLRSARRRQFDENAEISGQDLDLDQELELESEDQELLELERERLDEFANQRDQLDRFAGPLDLVVQVASGSSRSTTTCSAMGAHELLGDSCGRHFRQPPDEERPLIRGWPLESELNELDGRDDDDGELLDLWPVVELHENPLASFGARQPDPTEEAKVLERSQVFSLSPEQSSHRAAVQMINSNSVQLFVQQSEATPATSNKWPDSGNNLLMMMQQQQQLQQQSISVDNASRSAAVTSVCQFGSGGQEARRVAANGQAAAAADQRVCSRTAKNDVDEVEAVAQLEPAGSETATTTGDEAADEKMDEPNRRREQSGAASGKAAASGGGGGSSRQQQQVAAAVVERAINLHSAGQREQGGRRQVALPTLQQVQRQMQAAQARLEQRRRQWLRESPADDDGQRASTQNKTMDDADDHDDGLQPSGGATKTLLSASSSLLSSSSRLDGQSNNVEEQPDIGHRHLAGDRFAEHSSTCDNAQGQQQGAEAPIQDDTISRLNLLELGDGAQQTDGRRHSESQLKLTTRQQLEEALEPVTRTMTTLEPAPSPRSFEPQLDFKNELTIVTPTCPLMYQRIRELSNEEGSFSAQSTPNASILSSASNSTSSSSTNSNSLLTSGADMNSSEMISKLIERLDRKLVVMKKEQLALMKEIELNESNGLRLFESMRQQLTQAEFDKIQMHANEIEKVTKLILSLKLRLRRIEDELKEQQRQQNSQEPAASLTPIGNSQKAQEQTSQLFNSSHLDLHAQSNSSSTDSIQQQASTTSKAQSQHQQQQQQQHRGLSDPTSTSGLPKRNHNHHQHHASLLDGCQLDLAGKQQHGLYQNDSGRSGPTTTASVTAAGSVGVVATIVGNLNQAAAKRNQQHGQTRHNESSRTTTSNSSDSIFNYADSAIGSCTLTSTPNHGGSSNNINDKEASGCEKKSDDDEGGHHVSGRKFQTMTNKAVSPRTTISYSSLSSSASTSSERHHQFSSPPPPSHLSSSISVSSHGSLASSASVPSSPSLMSPISTTSSSTQNEQPKRDTNNNSNNNEQLDNSRSMFSSDSSALTLTNCDSIMNLISDVDILLAKRNKLVSQLEEAHQLEEFIGKRNSNIIERILKKYYTDELRPDGEIALFKQFTKLKSLLLKDSHDINDRIDNAEHQLKELRRTNHC